MQPCILVKLLSEVLNDEGFALDHKTLVLGVENVCARRPHVIHLDLVGAGLDQISSCLHADSLQELAER